MKGVDNMFTIFVVLIVVVLALVAVTVGGLLLPALLDVAASVFIIYGIVKLCQLFRKKRGS